MAITDGFLAFTHDLRAPIRNRMFRGFNGALPFAYTQIVDGSGNPYLDVTASQGGIGWRYWPDVASALRHCGLWPDGWPARVFVVQASADAVERPAAPGGVADQYGAVKAVYGAPHQYGVSIPPGTTLTLHAGTTVRRASQITLTAEVAAGEIESAIGQLSAVFAPFASAMTQQQVLWRQALSRPNRNAAAIAAHLGEALSARGLAWTLTQYSSLDALLAAAGQQPESLLALWSETARRAAATAVWENCRRAARLALSSQNVGAESMRDALWTAADAGVKHGDHFAIDAAHDALTVYFAASMGWTSHTPGLLTTGYRDAFEDGLLHALPTGTTQLGWVMRSDSP